MTQLGAELRAPDSWSRAFPTGILKEESNIDEATAYHSEFLQEIKSSPGVSNRGNLIKVIGYIGDGGAKKPPENH